MYGTVIIGGSVIVGRRGVLRVPQVPEIDGQAERVPAEPTGPAAAPEPAKVER